MKKYILLLYIIAVSLPVYGNETVTVQDGNNRCYLLYVPNDIVADSYFAIYIVKPSIFYYPSDPIKRIGESNLDFLNPIYVKRGTTVGELFDSAVNEDDWFAKLLCKNVEFKMYRSYETSYRVLFYYSPAPYERISKNKRAPERKVILKPGDSFEILEDPPF